MSIPELARQEHFAVSFTGELRVPADGLYTLALRSDDGSRLYLHDELRIDNDGLHGSVEKLCRVGLSAGRHTIRVDYFNATGGQDLQLSWEGPGFSRVPVSSNDLSHREPQ